MATLETTIFRPSQSQSVWNFGINCKAEDVMTLSNQIKNLSTQFVRFFADVQDPGSNAIYFDDAAFDTMWENSGNIKTMKTRYVFWTLRGKKSKIILSSRSAPKSWLSEDETNELRGEALVAFARMMASCVIVHTKKGMITEWVEMIDEPGTSTDGTFITPENLVILFKTFKSIMTQRSIIANIVSPKIMGPGIKHVVTKLQSSEPYIDAFRNSGDLLDAWSIHAMENPNDVLYFNGGNYEARCYMKANLTRTVNFMKWAVPNIPLYVTKFASNASRYSTLIDFGPSSSEMPEYALRLMDNVCGIASSGCSAACSWFVSGKRDRKALYRDNGSKRPQVDALIHMSKVMPKAGKIFLPLNEPVSGTPKDETLKIFAANRNSFGFILSRAQRIDGMNGSLCLQIENPEWATHRDVSTLSLYSFPAYISLSGIEKSISLIDGKLIINFARLPYNCAIFGKGDVYETFPLSAPKIPRLDLSVTRVQNTLLILNPREGDVVFDLNRTSLMVFTSGIWKECRAD